MKRLAWLTDIHLNFLRPPAVEAFLASLAETEADAFLIGGDIGEAPDVCTDLNALANRVAAADLLRPGQPRLLPRLHRWRPGGGP